MGEKSWGFSVQVWAFGIMQLSDSGMFSPSQKLGHFYARHVNVS